MTLTALVMLAELVAGPVPSADPCAPLRVIVLGDSRAAVGTRGPSAAWPGVLAEALRLRPALLLHTGDFVRDGRDAGQWRRLLRTLPAEPPLRGVRGNHDRGPHFSRSGLAPSAARVWAFRAGPLFVVGLDTEGPESAALLPELDRLLGQAGDAWTVVLTHRPVWSRGHHGSDEIGLNASLVPLLDRHRVDLVISGHDHDYERFCPQRGLGAQRICVEPGAGTVYIVSGGGGAPNVPFPGLSGRVPQETAEIDARTSRSFSRSAHFVVLEVFRDSLHARAVRTRTGNFTPPGIIDAFVLTHPDGALGAACARRPPDAGVSPAPERASAR